MRASASDGQHHASATDAWRADRPVFITGTAFSGKTPLRRILGTHPEFAMTRRTKLWTTHMGRYGDLASPQALDRCLHALASDPAVRELGVDLEAVRADLSTSRVTYEAVFASIHRQHATACGKPRWGDQIGDLGSTATSVLASFPGARVVHVVRHPEDVATMARVRGRGRRRSVRKIAQRWREAAEQAVRGAADDRYVVLRFEDLVERPADAMSQLLTRLEAEPLPEFAGATEEIERFLTREQADRKDTALGATGRASLSRVCWPLASRLGYLPGEHRTRRSEDHQP